MSARIDHDTALNILAFEFIADIDVPYSDIGETYGEDLSEEVLDDLHRTIHLQLRNLLPRQADRAAALSHLATVE